jgi:hypothetical protein
MNNVVIFDLDGTLALIDDRRAKSLLKNGKMDWDVFFDPKNIELDKPNMPVIHMARMLTMTGHDVVIFSGRSDATREATKAWLEKYKVPFTMMKMRPASGGFKFMPDDKLKQLWLDELFPDRNTIIGVFDDRQKVVDMWRSNGITCFQVAEGDF